MPTFIYTFKILCSITLKYFPSIKVLEVASLTDNSLHNSQHNFKNIMRKVCVFTQTYK